MPIYNITCADETTGEEFTFNMESSCAEEAIRGAEYHARAFTTYIKRFNSEFYVVSCEEVLV